MAASLGGAASLSLQPGDELLDGELLGKGGPRVAARNGRSGSRGSSRGAGDTHERGWRGAERRSRGSWGGGNSRSGGGDRSSRAARTASGSRAGAGAGATDSEVNARLVGLVDLARVPPKLEDTVTSGGALAAEVRGDGDVEILLVGLGASSSRGVGRESFKGRANHSTGLGVDDRHVGNTGVGSGNVELDGNGLARSVSLHVGLIVLELHALACPEVAVSSIEVGLRCRHLLSRLNVAIDVGAPHAEHLLTASSLESITGLTGSWRNKVTVTGDSGSQGSKAESGSEGLHSDRKV